MVSVMLSITFYIHADILQAPLSLLNVRVEPECCTGAYTSRYIKRPPLSLCPHTL